MRNHEKGSVKLINADCMEVMAEYPDNYFDLAVVDPPYGIGVNNMTLGSGKYKNTGKEWDLAPPDSSYFMELFRVSKNQIVWGANYMTNNLPPSMGWVYWDKMNGASDFSDGELAFTSFKRALRSYRYNISQDRSPRFHPTQKPIHLYEWLLLNYSDPSQKILDTHLGSGSSAIAAHYFGSAEFVGIEIDEEYFDNTVKRFEQQTAQIKLF